MAKRGSYRGGSTLLQPRWFGQSSKPTEEEKKQIRDENLAIAKSRGRPVGISNRNKFRNAAKKEAKKEKMQKWLASGGKWIP